MRKGIVWATVLLAFGLSAVMAANSSAQAPANADLAIVSKTANARHSKIGREVTFTIVATNNGPDAAELDVTEKNLDGLRLVSETCDRGISADTPSCEYGTVGPGETVTTTAVVDVTGARGKYAYNTACVSSEEPINDSNSANDCVTTRLRIIGRRR